MEENIKAKYLCPICGEQYVYVGSSSSENNSLYGAFALLAITFALDTSIVWHWCTVIK